MNSDQQSIKNQGGGEPKPYEPDEGGSGGNQNQPPTPPKSPGGGNSGDSQPSPGGGGGGNQPPNPPQPGGESGGDNQGGSQPPQPGQGGNPNQGGGGPTPSSGQGGPGFPPSSGSSGGPSGGGGGSEGGGPPSEPPQQFNPDEISGQEYPPEDSSSSSNKKLFIILLIIIVALGAAVAVYFLFLAPSGTQTPPAGENQAQQQDQPADTQATTTEEDEESTTTDEMTTGTQDFEVPTVDEGTTTETQATGTTDQTGQDGMPASSHESMFSSPADAQTEISLASVNLSNLQSALEFSPTNTPLLREVVLKDSNNNLVTTNELASVLAPNVLSSGILESFNQDPTVFTYSDQNGTWMGLVLQVNQDANLSSIKDQVSNFEANLSEVRNFYLSDPGSANAWQDGGAGNVNSRYITFSQSGAAFNYGWSGNKLVIGTSYSAFQEAVNSL